MGVYILLGVFLVLYAGFRDGDAVLDYENYLQMYEDVKLGNPLLTEPTFIWIASLSSSSVMLFVIYALLGVGLKLFAIKQLSQLWFLSLVIYISNFFILHELTQIRAGVAAALLLLCVKPIYERNWKLFLLFSIAAILFHASALIILPLWFLTYSKQPHRILLALGLPIAYVVYFSGINLVGIIPIPGIQEKLEMYQELKMLGGEEWSKINVFNAVFLLKIGLFYLLLWKAELVETRNKYFLLMMNIFCISLMSFPLFAAMPVVGFRINELFGMVEILLFPMIYYIFRPKIMSKSIVVSIGCLILMISIFYNKLIV
ncbi:MAG: EpsG family protein [Alistipes sp.]